MYNIDFDIKKSNLYEQIAEKLEDVILQDASQLGQKLPSEQALADSFGVSRNVVRESLKVLKERGLVTLRNGEGAYITKPEQQSFTDVVNRIILMDNIEIDYVYEMRMLLEMNSCRLAAKRATDDQLKQLTLLTDEMEQKKNDLDIRAELDLHFHTEIAKITGNPLLVLFIQAMSSVLKDIILVGINIPGRNEDGIIRHKNIIKAIYSHDPEQAAAAMYEHLMISKDNVGKFKTDLFDRNITHGRDKK